MFDIFKRACEQSPDKQGVRKTRWAIIRNTYPDLKNTTAKTWKDWFGDKRYGQFVDVAPFEHRMRFALPDKTTVAAEVIFLALDSEDDVKKLLSLELTGAYVNESREVRKAVISMLDGRIGRYPAMRDGGPSWYGIIMDSNMPDDDHWMYAAFKNNAEGWEFHIQPGGVIKQGNDWVPNPEAENLPNLVPNYYARQLAGKDERWVQVHLAAEWGRLNVEGTYYGEEMLRAERDKRAGSGVRVFYDPALPIHTFWDMGVADRMCIWFGQVSQNQWRWLHYYQNSGKSLAHYAGYIDTLKREREWEVWGSDVWPHDGNVREMTAIAEDMDNDNALSRADVWFGLTKRRPVILGRHKIGDRIEATRTMIRTSIFDEDTNEGQQKIRRYHRRYDKVRSVFVDEPDHDENSHGADALGTAAMGKDAISNNSGTTAVLNTLPIVNFKASWVA